MKKRFYPFFKIESPAIKAKGTFGSVWRSYRSDPEIGFSGLSILHRTAMNALVRLRFRRIGHLPFDHLSLNSYEVQRFDDCAAPLDPKKSALRGLPEYWNIPEPVIVPKISRLPDAVHFYDGTVLLPDGHFCSKRVSWKCIMGISEKFDDGVRRDGKLGIWSRFAKIFWHDRATRFKAYDIVDKPVSNSRQELLFYPDPVTRTALVRRHIPCVYVPGRCFTTRLNKLTFLNYGHFVHDVLSLIYYEDLGAIAPGRDKVIAPPMFMPMQEALFRKVFEGYEIVQASPHYPLRAEELLYPAGFRGLKRNGFNPAATASLARRMRRIMTPYSGKGKRKVCVSRRDGRDRHSHARNFANEYAYEARMRELGYDVVEVSALDPEDQFALWANTTDIVGIHGAGMMNMIMMPSGSNFTEIAGAAHELGEKVHCPNFNVRCAMAAGHNVGGLSATIDAQGNPVIDLDKLEAMLLDAS